MYFSIIFEIFEVLLIYFPDNSKEESLIQILSIVSEKERQLISNKLSVRIVQLLKGINEPSSVKTNS